MNTAMSLSSFCNITVILQHFIVRSGQNSMHHFTHLSVRWSLSKHLHLAIAQRFLVLPERKLIPGIEPIDNESDLPLFQV